MLKHHELQAVGPVERFFQLDGDLVVEQTSLVNSVMSEAGSR